MATRTPEEIDAFCRRAAEHWNRSGGRRTPVREVISRVAAEQAAPFSAEELLALARRVDRGISHASVYRALSGLVSAGLLHEFEGPGGLRCYAPADEARKSVGSIVCSDCGQIVPMNDACLPFREGFLARQLGFTPSKMTLRIEASCEELRRRGDCARRKRKKA